MTRDKVSYGINAFPSTYIDSCLVDIGSDHRCNEVELHLVSIDE